MQEIAAECVMDCIAFYHSLISSYHCNCKHVGIPPIFSAAEKELVEKMGGEEKLMSSGTPLKATTTEQDTLNSSVLSSGSSADTPVKQQTAEKTAEDSSAKPVKIQGEIRKKDPATSGVKKKKSFGHFHVS